MDLNDEFTEEGLENFFNPIGENPKLIQENPSTPNDLNIQVPINDVQEDTTSTKNHNPITDLPTKNQLSSALPAFNPNPIATPASNNLSNPISGVPVQSERLAISPINPSPSNDEQDHPILKSSIPTDNKVSDLSQMALQRKRPASPLPPHTELCPKKATIDDDKSTSSPPKEPLLFSFKLKSSKAFCHAVQVLSDTNLNPERLAMTEVDDSGFKFIIYNDSTKAMGILHLKTELLDEFECAQNFKKLSFKMLDGITHMCEKAARIGYQDGLRIYSTQGSQCILWFEFDEPHKDRYSIIIPKDEKLRLLSYNEKWWPGNVSEVCYEARILTDALKRMISLLVQNKTVTMELTHMNVRISINKEYSVYLPTASTGVPQGQLNQSKFEFPHGDSLKKACSLSEVFTAGVLNSPDRLVLQFGIENLGTLIYIKPCVHLRF